MSERNKRYSISTKLRMLKLKNSLSTRTMEPRTNNGMSFISIRLVRMKLMD
jgi:hypothetical protein